MYFITYTLPKLFPTQLDHGLRKDVFSFYKLLEKLIFMSLGGAGSSGHKMGRKKYVEFMFEIEIEK